MATGTGLSDYVTKAKQWHLRGREQLRSLHDEGATGRRVVGGMSDLLDSIIKLLFDHIQNDLQESGEKLESRFALVLHGGSGRREVAPFSDVDVMVLYRGESDAIVEQFVSRFTRDVCDAGYPLGISVRTPREACSMALKDASIFSSLTESRLICGSKDLHDNYFSRLKRLAQRRSRFLIRTIIEARQAERIEFGETVYLLRPNVKKSRGALRDVHLVRWIGFIRFGETDIDQLCRKGAISTTEANQLNQANEFLLRLRNELHFSAGRANDMFGKNEQVRIAEKFGYRGSDVSLAVEELMRDYFRRTGEIRYCSDHFVESSQNRRTIAQMFTPLMSRPLDEIYRIGPFQVSILPEFLDSAKNDIEKVLRLMQLSTIHSKDIDYQTWEAIRDSMIAGSNINMSDDAGSQFMALLRSPTRLGDMLRRLAELRVLERIIPDFAHARSLLQFNEYHKYTVDEHSILAVESANEFSSDKGILGKTYRSLRDKGLLHLALLIHDLGKGYAEDHSEVGRRLAEKICPELGLSEEDAETVKFLVHNHLVMSHVAFQRDIHDAKLIAEFAANVGTKKMLQMLYLLTCADISAVGPEALNPWKFGLLTGLYGNALRLFEGLHDESNEEIDQEEMQAIRAQSPDEETAQWLFDQARKLPAEYYQNHKTGLMTEQLMELRKTTGYESACWVFYSHETQMMELCIGRRVKRRSGIYYRITGMLASQRLRIRTADIKHLADSFVWYWFQFDDPNLTEPPNDSRLLELQALAKRLAEGKESRPPNFPFRWQDDPSRNKQNVPMPAIRVLIDNHTVQWATVIEVIAYYRLGLLYRISKKIYELNLDVRFARIATFGMQIIDVFYVTDEDGKKISDPDRIAFVKQQLLDETTSFLHDHN